MFQVAFKHHRVFGGVGIDRHSRSVWSTSSRAGICQGSSES
uniref:Macaca fascicularis brain cDNA clone: QmoA-11423, similar to human FLJ41841 protein (FLJ41841), mRNA, RefSeq: NM_207499.1 n=1 Tax=Macaca fascicularis TaxID=9541 RepID=I7GN59_MACFA|nr:unnamed protein product [Macaca fascicularis]